MVNLNPTHSKQLNKCTKLDNYTNLAPNIDIIAKGQLNV